MAWKGTGSPLPPASLHLLVPPVRLLSAFMWQIVEQHSVMQYDKLVDLISLVTEIVPELLSPSQRAQIILGLRARLVLELCRGDGVANLQTIQSHLDKIHTCSAELSATDQMAGGDILKTSYTNFASLVQNLLNVPFEKEFFFQEVFPVNYGSNYDQSLQQLVSELLARLEQLLPIPDLQQTVAWLTETSVSEEFGLHLSEPFALKTLLLHHRQLGTLSSAPSSSEEDILLSTLALPAQTAVERFAEPYSEEEDYDNEEESLALEQLEEDSSQSSDAFVNHWLPKRESGPLSRLFICPQCSFAHRIKKKVQDHILSEHLVSDPIQKKIPVKKAAAKTQQKSKDLTGENIKVEGNFEKKRKHKQKGGVDKKQEHKQKKDNLENKRRRRRKETTGEDKRFLSTRPVNKNFTEEEIRCLKCRKVFELPNQLKTHMRLHSYAYCCIQCEKGFTSSSGYYQHQRLHKRGRKFFCSQCNKGFLCNYSLKQHERLHEGPTNLCTICGKGFSKTGITRHMQMHKGEKNYLCTTCGKSFFSSGELLLHNRSHTGEVPYTCTHCGKGFSSKSHLNVHTRSHTGERPYLCSECPKRFLTLNCLKRHTLSHNGVKPFKCTSCEREFSQQGNLKRHLATHKPDT
ncbi:zinc finger and SCAN domain-containing protein 30-like [Centropristis striata]|uniref:zinc finger and SCAN domain-containing protein 30-like n=1 Tax=Centropristis striata TaxID=184440 RepID=UPI0027DFF0B3|nr:zinc finger and SCAN domain-containing protein 30-like [Centropristis striata]